MLSNEFAEQQQIINPVVFSTLPNGSHEKIIEKLLEKGIKKRVILVIKT